ncbi:MAG: hypothetical protein DRG78_14305 [Epsilonproteobacteria bacterium]|nr:MAG: hypothetical protein DRG78_14305 [Campylobacterota bacterium]
MKKMILLFSHKLSDEQKEEAKDKYRIEEFVYLSKELQQIWSNISPDLDSLSEVLKLIKEFTKQNANKNDVVLIQGDFGAVYTMVNFCKDLELVPVYATTKRIAQEYLEDNKSVKKSIFEFRRFREYE